MSIYRRLYEQAHGPIPKGYHIHHKDGNHSNNDLSNLVAITAKEHYDIHFSQGDYGACWAMYRTGHMTLSPEERSFIVKKSVEKQLRDGIHVSQRPGHMDKIREPLIKRLEDGTHHFLSGDIQREENRKRIDNGTHNLLGEHNPIHKRVLTGVHQKMMKQENLKRIENKTHNFTMEWTCEFCGKSGTNQTNYIRWHGQNCKMKRGGE